MTGALDTFEAHDWTVTLDADDATIADKPSLKKDSLVEPWATYVIRHGTVLDGPHTTLTRAAMKRIARSDARMILA